MSERTIRVPDDGGRRRRRGDYIRRSTASRVEVERIIDNLKLIWRNYRTHVPSM